MTGFATAAVPAEQDGIHVTTTGLISLAPRCRALRLPSRRPARSALAGPHQSRFRGRGVDFLESRHYLPGDDIRNMDWRVTARTGKAHTKVFQEERERPVVVVVDRNPSMFFGTRKQLKSVTAAQLAAAIGWMAITRGDRIGGVLFGADIHHEVRPAGGRRGVMRLIQQLSKWCNPETVVGQNNPMGEVLLRLRNVVRPGSLLVIISDFYNIDDSCGRHLSRLAQHNDVIGCQVLDDAEDNLPPGRYAITDGEDQAMLDTCQRGELKKFRNMAAQHRQVPKDLFRRYGAHWFTVSTSQDPVDALSRQVRLLNAI